MRVLCSEVTFQELSTLPAVALPPRIWERLHLDLRVKVASWATSGEQKPHLPATEVDFALCCLNQRLFFLPSTILIISGHDLKDEMIKEKKNPEFLTSLRCWKI